MIVQVVSSCYLFLLCLVVFFYCVYCKLKVGNRLEYEKPMFF